MTIIKGKITLKIRKVLKVGLLLLLLPGLTYGVGLACKYRLFGRTWFNIQAFIQADEWRRKSLDLSSCRAVIQAKPVQDAAGLSGLTHNHDTGTLFAVSDHGGYILELDLEGEVLRRIGLADFPDPEAIEYIGDDLYLIADETDQSVSLVPINAETAQLSAKDIKAKLALGMEFSKNRSFEGLAYDPDEKTIYVAKEHKPRRLYVIKGFIRDDDEPLNLYINNDPACENRLFLKDLSGLAFDRSRRHLLVLSHESRLLVELDQDNKPISSLSLLKYNSGLSAGIPQAEGVALGPDGTIYIVSEPNLFYVFRKTGL